MTDPSGWTANDDGTFLPPPKADPQNWFNVAPNVQRTVVKDGALLIYDSSGILRARMGKQLDGSYDIESFDVAGANPIKMSTLAFGMAGATVVAAEDRTSSSYGDLATVGPQVSNVLVGPSGRLLVTVVAHIVYTSGRTQSYMGFAISGATTVAPSDVLAATFGLSTGGAFTVDAVISNTILVTGLNSGLHTVTAKYRGVSNVDLSATFDNRRLIVQPY